MAKAKNKKSHCGASAECPVCNSVLGKHNELTKRVTTTISRSDSSPELPFELGRRVNRRGQVVLNGRVMTW